MYLVFMVIALKEYYNFNVYSYFQKEYIAMQKLSAKSSEVTLAL